MRIFLTCLALLNAVNAASITLRWYPNPVAERVTVYEVKAAEVFGMREWTAQTDGTSLEMKNLPAEPCLFFLRAGNAGGWSDFNAPLVATPKVRVRVTLQASSDMSGWVDVLETRRPLLEKEFFRVRTEVEP